MNFAVTDDFEELITREGKYIDKTLFLKMLYGLSFNDDRSRGEYEVMIFTRPRRFGKTLTLSMIESFFKLNMDNPADTSKQQALFADLAISKDAKFCAKHLGQYPVIRISLKDTCSCSTYTEALHSLLLTIAQVISSYAKALIASGKLDQFDQKWLQNFCDLTTTRNINWSDPSVACNIEVQLVFSLSKFTSLLFQVYGKKTIVLIDDYDAPLYFATLHDDGTNKYYQNMHSFLTSFFSCTFKTQPYLEKGILVGCAHMCHADDYSGFNNYVLYSTQVSHLKNNSKTLSYMDSVLCKN